MPAGHAAPTWTRSGTRIEPLASAGKLGRAARAVPAELPATTTRPASTWRWLLQAFCGLPGGRRAAAPQLERRTGRTRSSLLNAHGAALVQIDEPKFRFSIRQNHLPNLRSFYYMRLHGRNAAKWWTHDQPEERYNYLYSPAEIDGFADTVDQRAAARPEDLRLHEQPLRREGGGQRGGPAPRRGTAGPRRVPGRDARPVSVPRGDRDADRAATRCSMAWRMRGGNLAAGRGWHRRGRRASGRLVARIQSAGAVHGLQPPHVRLPPALRALRTRQYYFIYIRLTVSPTSILSTTSIPDVTCPKIAYLPSGIFFACRVM